MLGLYSFAQFTKYISWFDDPWPKKEMAPYVLAQRIAGEAFIYLGSARLAYYFAPKAVPLLLIIAFAGTLDHSDTETLKKTIH